MRMFVVGYYGSGNLGDESILEIFLGRTARMLPGVEFRVLSINPEATKKRHGVKAVGTRDFAGLFRALRWCNAVVMPGGSIIQDSSSKRSAAFYLSIIRMARFMGRAVFMLSQGFGPLKDENLRTLTGRVMDRCVTYVWFRESEAKAAAHEVGMSEGYSSVSADMVFAAQKLAGKDYVPGGQESGAVAETDSPVRIGISLRPCDMLNGTVSALSEVVKKIDSQSGVEVYIFALDPGEDTEPVLEFEKKLKSERPGIKVETHGTLPGPPLNMGNTLHLLKKLDVFAGIRLHSLIFCALADIPFIAFPYDPKVRDFAKICEMPVIHNPGPQSVPAIEKHIEELMNGEAAGGHMSQVRANAVVKLDTMFDEFDHELQHGVSGECVDVLGVPVSVIGFDATINRICETATNPAAQPLQIVTVNPEIIINARRTPELGALLRGGTMNPPDGVGVRLAALVKYFRMPQVVTGVDITHRLLELSREKDLRIFLLGAKPEVLARALINIESRIDRPKIVGSHHGYIRDLDQNLLAERVRASGANVILAAMGSPMQEFWGRDYANLTGAKVFIGVGGTFDVIAGVKKRAPKIMQRLGLEWFWRVLQEPSRIGRTVAIPIFVASAILDVFNRRNKWQSE